MLQYSCRRSPRNGKETAIIDTDTHSQPVSDVTLYRARHLASMDGPPIEDGGLLVAGEKIVAVGRHGDLIAKFSGSKVRQIDLGDVILFPGLINAHCHLEYTSLRNLILSQTTFARWIQRINSSKRHLTDNDYLAATLAGAAELVRHGATSVVNIESFPELLDRPVTLPLRTWWCYEMLDIRLRHHNEASMHGAWQFFQPSESALTHFGLSPHAPYTTSTELYRLAAAAAESGEMLLTTHVAESAEEMQMLRDASGPLYDFLQSLGREMSDCGATTPLQLLIEKGGLRPADLLVHLNELTTADYALLARWAGGQNIHVAHCPKSHRFFQHTPFPYEKLLAANANISLGTDSLASNDRLNLFAEMRCFAENFPTVSPIEILEMVTRNPARTLRQPATLGVFRSGAWADAIAIPADNLNGTDVYEHILQNQKPISWMIIAGKIIGK